MAELIRKLSHGDFQYGDIARLTRAVKGSSGKRYKFVGAVFDGDSQDPMYFDLIEIGRGQMRAIKPEFVVRDVAASKAARARMEKKLAKTNDS